MKGDTSSRIRKAVSREGPAQIADILDDNVSKRDHVGNAGHVCDGIEGHILHVPGAVHNSRTCGCEETGRRYGSLAFYVPVAEPITNGFREDRDPTTTNRRASAWEIPPRPGTKRSHRWSRDSSQSRSARRKKCTSPKQSGMENTHEPRLAPCPDASCCRWIMGETPLEVFGKKGILASRKRKQLPGVSKSIALTDTKPSGR